MLDIEAIPKLKLKVPTYYGGVPQERIDEFELQEFGEPGIDVLVHSSDGVRIILGTHDFSDYSKPDVQIERRPNGWAIFLNPDAGDPSGYVYLLDDGRSFLVPERGPGAIEVLDDYDVPPEIDAVDGPVPTALVVESARTGPARTQKTCSRCRQTREHCDDWYDNLCPECADHTDGDWKCTTCGRNGSFEVMGGEGSTDPKCCGSTCNRINPFISES